MGRGSIEGVTQRQAPPLLLPPQGCFGGYQFLGEKRRTGRVSALAGVGLAPIGLHPGRGARCPGAAGRVLGL